MNGLFAIPLVLPDFAHLVLWFVIYSIIGWIWETVVCSVSQRGFARRGFLYGPYLPIYGFGAVADIVFVGWIADPFVLFAAGAILASCIEYLTSWAFERAFHRRWWDYSDRPFNIHGRICLLGIAIFGGFALLLMYAVHPAVVWMLELIPSYMQTTLAAWLLAFLLLDTAFSVLRASGVEDRLRAQRPRLSLALPGIGSRIQESRWRLNASVRGDAPRRGRGVRAPGILRPREAKAKLIRRLRIIRDRAA